MYNSETNRLPCLVRREFRFRALPSKQSAGWHAREQLRRKAKEVTRTMSFVDYHHREASCLTEAGARARYLARPGWSDERMWLRRGSSWRETPSPCTSARRYAEVGP